MTHLNVNIEFNRQKFKNSFAKIRKKINLYETQDFPFLISNTIDGFFYFITNREQMESAQFFNANHQKKTTGPLYLRASPTLQIKTGYADHGAENDF